MNNSKRLQARGRLKPGQPFNPFGLFNGIFVPEALVRAKGISPGAKLAYGRLTRYAGQDGRCYPSVGTLASEIGVEERQVQRYLAELGGAKLIRRVSRFADHGGPTSNAFEFLWHPLFENGMRGGVVSDVSPGVVSDVSPKESHGGREKSDLDYLACESQKPLFATPGFQAGGCAPHQHPKLRESLADYMAVPGDKDRVYPSDRQVVDIMDAAAGATEAEVVACLRYLYHKRGLRPGTKHGPRHFAWFKRVVAEYFQQERDQAYPAAAPYPNGKVAGLSKEDFDRMTSAIDVIADGDPE